MLKSYKQLYIKKLQDILLNHQFMILVHYHGLNFNDIGLLRKELRKVSSNFIVVKNSLARIAAQNNNMNALSDFFSGPTGIVCANSIIVAKIIVQFARNSNLKIVCGFLDNKIVDLVGINELSILPTIDEIRSKIIRLVTFSNFRLVNVLNNYISKNK